MGKGSHFQRLRDDKKKFGHSGRTRDDRLQMQRSTGLSDNEMADLTKLGSMNLLSRMGVLGAIPFEHETLQELDEALSDPPTDEQVASAVEAAHRVLGDTA